MRSLCNNWMDFGFWHMCIVWNEVCHEWNATYLVAGPGFQMHTNCSLRYMLHVDDNVKGKRNDRHKKTKHGLQTSHILQTWIVDCDFTRQQASRIQIKNFVTCLFFEICCISYVTDFTQSPNHTYISQTRPQTTHFLVYDTALCPTTRHERRKMSNDLKITWWVIIQGRKVFANIIILLTRGGHAQACPPADFDLQFSTTLHWRTSSHCRKKAINVLSSCLRYSSLFYNGALCIHLQGGFARRATACWQWMHMDIVWNLRCSLHM